MKTTGNFISILVKFTPRMEDRHDDLESGDIATLFLRFLFMAPYRNSPAVVFNGDRIVLVQSNCDLRTMPSEGLVDAVVGNLIDELVQAVGMGIADVHPRTLAYRLKTFKNSNRTGIVLIFFGHCRHTLNSNSKFLRHAICMINPCEN